MNMFRNSKYLYGASDVVVAVKLNFGDFIVKKLLEHGDNICMINGATDERLTFREIAQNAVNLAISLRNIGVRKGDTVAICSENRLEFFSTVVGVVCTGAILSPINVGYGEAETKHVLNISKPDYIICSETVYLEKKNLFMTLAYVKKIILYGPNRHNNSLLYNDLVSDTNNWLNRGLNIEEFEPVAVQGQVDTLFILYSSGTTGLPKGVMLTHLNVITFCNVYIPILLDDMDAAALVVSPWYHSMGFMGSLASLCQGKKIVFLSKFEIKLYLDAIERYKIMQLSVVPSLLMTICKTNTNHDVSSVKLIYSGAAPLRRDMIDTAHQKFPNVSKVLQGYGMTECTLPVTRDSPNEVKPGSVGRVVRGVVVKVVDIETRQTLGPNQPGEICVKSPMVMKGYIGKKKSDDFDDEDFYKTGDIGYYDEDKYFFIVDRLKDLIKYKGFQVPPAEIEAFLLRHGAVQEVAVVGVEDKQRGEIPLAFVVVQPTKTVSEKELKDYVAANLSNPKHLRGGVIFIDSLPKNPSGKTLRKELRKMAMASKKSKL